MHILLLAASAIWLGWSLCDFFGLRRKRAELNRQIKSWRAAAARWEQYADDKARGH